MSGTRRSILKFLAAIGLTAPSKLVRAEEAPPPNSTHHPKGERLSYEQSCRRLQALGLLEAGDIPALRASMPNYDDEVLAVEFFRTFVGDGVDLGHLTLPRTYFGRSEISNASFRNTDLHESRMCWNDFTNVDFSEADLQRCDLRGSAFEKVNFSRARLDGADLRRSGFDACNFADASMSGCIITNAQRGGLTLSDSQRKAIACTDDEGPEPDGG
ncbi:pentapeptide repeat-containing protein [Salmonella enterica subsp. enterica serovar Virchow]|nr:pentapeptide repeat-containing protein [Salmonella enterica subsp. enterica serovar Virchow]